MTNFKVPFFQPISNDDGIFLWFRSFFGRWSGEDLLKTRVVPIGAWDMDGTASVSIPFGDNLDFRRIEHLGVIINNDSEDIKFSNVSGISLLTADDTNINITRESGGIFDGPTFSDTSINRGDIVIWFST